MMDRQNINLRDIYFLVDNPIIPFNKFSHIPSFKFINHSATIWLNF